MTDDYDTEIPEEGGNPARESQKKGLYFYFAVALLGCLIFLVVFVNFPAMQASAGTTMTRTGWQLQACANTSGGMEPAAGQNITARFERDGKLSGFAGCNYYSATYTTTNYAIHISPAATSRKYCAEPGVMALETVYLANLNAATEFRVTDDALKLYNRTGKPLLAFNAGPA